jgi:hypothetical protein
VAVRSALGQKNFSKIPLLRLTYLYLGLTVLDLRPHPPGIGEDAVWLFRLKIYAALCGFSRRFFCFRGLWHVSPASRNAYFSAVRRGIFVDHEANKPPSPIGAAYFRHGVNLCRSYGALFFSFFGCYKYAAPDGAQTTGLRHRFVIPLALVIFSSPFKNFELT